MSFSKTTPALFFWETKAKLLQKTVKCSKIRLLTISAKNPKVFSPIFLKKWGKASKAPARLPYKITHIVFPQSVDI
jgi:hypothetical protein